MQKEFEIKKEYLINMPEATEKEENISKKDARKKRHKLGYNKWIVKNIPFYFFISALKTW